MAQKIFQANSAKNFSEFSKSVRRSEAKKSIFNGPRSIRNTKMVVNGNRKMVSADAKKFTEKIKIQSKTGLR